MANEEVLQFTRIVHGSDRNVRGVRKDMFTYALQKVRKFSSDEGWMKDDEGILQQRQADK